MSRSRPVSSFSGLLAVGVLVGCTLALPGRAQLGAAPQMPDPNKAIVIVDDAGPVGLRIADAQTMHEAVIAHLKKRLGEDAVIYEGLKQNAAKMKRMLGKDAETQIQDTQLAYFDAAEKAAPWRVRVRFGPKGKGKNGKHSIVVTCRKAGSSERAKPVDTTTVSGATFLAARDALVDALPAFCLQLPSGVQSIPIEGATPPSSQGEEVPGLRKGKKPLKPWTPPPRRD